MDYHCAACTKQVLTTKVRDDNVRRCAACQIDVLAQRVSHLEAMVNELLDSSIKLAAMMGAGDE